MTLRLPWAIHSVLELCRTPWRSGRRSSLRRLIQQLLRPLLLLRVAAVAGIGGVPVTRRTALRRRVLGTAPCFPATVLVLRSILGWAPSASAFDAASSSVPAPSSLAGGSDCLRSIDEVVPDVLFQDPLHVDGTATPQKMAAPLLLARSLLPGRLQVLRRPRSPLLLTRLRGRLVIRPLLLGWPARSLRLGHPSMPPWRLGRLNWALGRLVSLLRSSR